jgi:lysosomal alpha-mannosidase
MRATGAGLTLAIAVDRSQGGSSLADGALELMVHRRMLFDDRRGVGEALDEPGLDGRGLIVKGRHWLLLAPAAGAPPLYKALQLRSLVLPEAAVGFAALGALSPTAWRAAYKASASLLADPHGLPPNLHLTTVHLLNATTLLLRLTHVYDKGEHALSADASVDLGSLFAGLRVASAADYTLPGGMPLANVAPTTFTTDGGDKFTVPVLPAPPAGTALTVTLAPGEVRTFMCTVAWG